MCLFFFCGHCYVYWRSMFSLLERQAITDMLPHIDPAILASRFGTTFEQFSASNTLSPELVQLMDAKTLTLAKLLAVAPPGTVDPTPFLYDPALRTMAGLVAIAAISHAMITPVDPVLFPSQSDEPSTIDDKDSNRGV